MPPKGSRKNKSNKQNKQNKKQFAIQQIPQYRNLAPQSVMIRDSYQCQLKLTDIGAVNGQSSLCHVAFFDAADGYAIFNPINSGRENWSILSETFGGYLGSLEAVTSPYRRMYSHYYVLGSKMTVTVMPTANYTPGIEGNVQVSCGIVRDTTWPVATGATGTTLREFTQARNTTTRQIMASPGVAAGAPQAGSRARMFSSYSPKRLIGVKDVTDNDDLKVSVVDGKVPEASHYYLALQGLNNGGMNDPVKIAPYIVNVKIDYTLKFTEPISNLNDAINA